MRDGPDSRTEVAGPVGPARAGAPRRRGHAPWTSLLLAPLAVLAVAACGDEGPEGGPGVRTVAVVSPAGSEGAALVKLEGRGIEGVSAVDGRVFYHARGDTARVMIVREDAGELRFAVELADTLSPPRGTVLDVADGGNVLRTVLSGYAVEIRP